MRARIARPRRDTRRGDDVRGRNEEPAGEDLELLPDLRDDAVGRRTTADLDPVRVLGGAARAKEESARVVRLRRDAAGRIDEAAAGEKREQVEVRVLLAPEEPKPTLSSLCTSLA